MITGPAHPTDTACTASIDFDAATAILAAAGVPLARRRVPLADAVGHILAEPIVARIDSPRRDVAAMDGYAVAADPVGETRSFALIGTSFPDTIAPGWLQTGEAMQVFTGAPIPDGTDRVVIQEIVKRLGTTIIIDGRMSTRRHIRVHGSDFSTGAVLIEAGRAVCSRTIAVAAAADLDMIEIWRRPQVAILATGDELAPAGHASRSTSSIPDCLSPALTAAIGEWGGHVVACQWVTDNIGALGTAVSNAVAIADVVLIIGGASKGKKDLSRSSLLSAGGRVVFAGVSMKPGKPFWYGRAGLAHVIGLPGNPTAAMTTSRLFVSPLLQALSGGRYGDALRWNKDKLVGNAPGSDREQFLCGRQAVGGVILHDRQSASSQSLLSDADAIVRIRCVKGSISTDDYVEWVTF